MPTLTGFPTPRGAATLILGFSLSLSSLAQAAETNCADTAKRVSREVGARPERVLVIVEDTLVVNDTCACEVVKAAIVAAGASAKLTSQIVFVAISAAPAKASQIAECAKAASPEATAEIDEAVRKAVGDNPTPADKPSGDRPESSDTAAGPTPTDAATPSGKEPIGKKPPPPDTPPSEDADFGLSPVAIGGVYLVYPGGSGASPIIKDDNGRLFFVGPNGRRVPLEPPPPRVIQRPRPPGIIIIRPPTPTASDDIPLEPVPPDDTPIDPTPIPDPA